MSIKGFEVGGVQQQYDYTALDNIPANLVQDANYVHTDNNYTNADKTKLSGIEAQANKTTIDATLTHSGQAADAKATGDAISALDAQVIASMPHDTASGAIASFPDGAAMPVIDCSVAVAPNQDLHGYDSPWPAGGGKNLYNASIITGQGSTGNNGVVCTVSNGVINLNGTATSNAYFSVNGLHLPSGNYAISANNPIGTNGVHIALRDENGNYYSDSGLSQTNHKALVSSRDINTVIIYVKQGTQLTNFKLQPQVEVGTEATSWTPYSNICPIYGHTDADVVRTGVNQWDEEWEVGAINTSGIPFVNNNRIRSKNYIPVIGGGTYYIEAPVQLRVCQYSADKTFLSLFGAMDSTATLLSDCCYLKFCTNVDSYGTTYNNDISINYPSTDHDYHAYTGTTYPIPLGQTVYGGTLDVTTGKLTVNRAIKTFDGSEPWVASSQQGYYCNANYIPKLHDYKNSITCDKLKTFNYYTEPNYIAAKYGITGYYDYASSYPNKNWIYVKAASIFSDTPSFKQWLANNPITVCYELATPIKVDLTPTEITTLLGTNNIWADAGDTTVNYYADTTLFVNKKIAAAVAAMS